jgi:hypothetical protein
MNWNSKIANQDITIKKNTLNITDTIEEANSSNFTYVNEDYREIITTQPVEINTDNKNRFRGYVSNISQTLRYGGTLISDIDCQGQDYLLQKRIITKAFKNEKVEDIVKYMIDNILSEEGITAGKINAPAVVEAIAFNSMTCYNALDQLIMFGDYIWNIDSEKKINFIQIADNRAPFDLDFSSNDCIALGGEYTIEQDAANYRNSILLQGVKGLSNRVEYFTGDGNTRSWNTKLKIYTVNGLWVDYNDGNGFVAETFAPNTEANNNGNYKFLFDAGNNQIQHYEDPDDSTKTPALTNNNTIKVSYQGTYDLTFQHSNFEEIYKQKNIDLSSGKNEVVEEVECYGLSAAIQYARQSIEKNKKKGYRITFTTDKDGLEALQTIRVVIPQLKVDNDFLITSVNTMEQDIILYEVSVIDGELRDSHLTELFGDKEKFISDLKSSDSQDTANINITFEKQWEESENPNLFNTGIYPSNTLYPSDDLFPCLPDADRIQFIQLYKTVDGNYEPFLRIPITGDEVADNGNTYISVAIIDELVSFDTECTRIAWIVSDGLTMPTKEDFTSGIKIVEADVEVPFKKIGDLEVITILRIDTKWEEVSE